MSIHLMQCAAELKIDGRFTATHKLALMCMADSASRDTNLASPGLETVMTWTCAARSWIGEVTKDLVDMQLLAKERRACRGRNAEFKVFPNGCCAAHGLTGEPVTPATPKSARAVPFEDVSTTAPAVPFQTPIATAPPDPITSNGTGEPPANGTGEPPEWDRSTRSNLLSTKNPTTTTQQPKGHVTGPVTSRASSPPVDIDFTVVDLVQPDPLVAGPCLECEKGWLINHDGVPYAKCPQCHPGYIRTGRPA